MIALSARAVCLSLSLLLIAGPALAAAPMLVIHGGAAVEKSSLSPDQQAQPCEAMQRALRAGHAVLQRGGSAVDAVAATITVLEDAPQFNAGRGAVFTHDGKNELDAAIMDGASGKAGAIAGVHTVKNPIQLARSVMDRSQHVMLVGDGAEQFAREQGITLVEPSYFRTDKRWQQLQKALKAEAGDRKAQAALDLETAKHFGTVGALALDRDGHLAAVTSTGGMTNKRYGRVGDAPVIGPVPMPMRSAPSPAPAGASSTSAPWPPTISAYA